MEHRDGHETEWYSGQTDRTQAVTVLPVGTKIHEDLRTFNPSGQSSTTFPREATLRCQNQWGENRHLHLLTG